MPEKHIATFHTEKGDVTVSEKTEGTIESLMRFGLQATTGVSSSGYGATVTDVHGNVTHYDSVAEANEAASKMASKR